MQLRLDHTTSMSNLFDATRSTAATSKADGNTGPRRWASRHAVMTDYRNAGVGFHPFLSQIFFGMANTT